MNRMKLPSKKVGLILGILILAALIAFVTFSKSGDGTTPANAINNNQPGQQSDNQANASLSDEDIKNKFACNRITEQVLETDIYCRFPSLYRTGDIPDSELKEKLGCFTSSPSPLCFGEKYEQHKAQLLEQHKNLSDN